MTPFLRSSTLAVLGLGLALGSCGYGEAWSTGDPHGREFYVHCSDMAHRVFEGEDGTWRCPSGAAYDSHALGWTDASGQFAASLALPPAPPSPLWINFCDEVALVAFGGYEPDPEHPWLVAWGDAQTGWGAPAEVVTMTGYLDCQNARFYFVDHSTCYVLERGQEPAEVPCGTPIFRSRDAQWDFVDATTGG